MQQGGVSLGRVTAMLLGLGILSAVALIAMLFWLTGQIDRGTQANIRETHNLLLSEWRDALTLAVEDYAFWTLAYDVVSEGREAEVYDHLGSGATESTLFDWLFFLTADGDLLYAYGPTDIADAATGFDPAAAADFVERLRADAPADYLSVSAYSRWQGRIATVAAAWVTPDGVTPDEAASLPVAIGLKDLGPVAFDRLANATGARAISLATAGTGDTGNAGDSLEIAGLDGPIATLTWQSPRPGADLRGRAMPIVLAVSAAMLAICIGSARYFRRQGDRLMEATRLASTDQLTGLLNRAGLHAELNSERVKAALRAGHAAVVNLDLNEFKALNDRFGHKAGDLALKVTAERLQSAVRDDDRVARLGGDEFVCLILAPQPEKVAVAVGRRVAALCRAGIDLGSHTQVLRPAIGVAVGSPGVRWETLFERSDAAMYWAKKKGTAEPAIYCHSMHEEDAA